jgi:hypothetical protein
MNKIMFIVVLAICFLMVSCTSPSDPPELYEEKITIEDTISEELVENQDVEIIDQDDYDIEKELILEDDLVDIGEMI